MKETVEKLKRETAYLARGVMWLGATQAVASISALVLTLVLARYLDPEVYGSYRYVLSLVAVAGAFGLSGLGTGLMRSIARGKDGTYAHALQTGLRYAPVPALLLLAGAAYEYVYGAGGVGISLVIAAVGVMAINTFSLYKYYLTARRAYVSMLVVTALTELVPVVVLVAAVVYSTLDLVMLIALFFATHGVASIMGYIWSRLLSPVRNEERDPSLNERSKGLSFANIVSAVATYGDRLLIFHLMSPIDLARYAVAQTLPEQLRAVAKLGLSAVFPKLAAGSYPLRSLVLRSAFGLAAIGMLATLYALFAPLLIQLLFPAYTDVAGLSMLFALYSFLGVIFLLGTTLLSVRDDTKHVYHANLSLSVFMLLLVPLAIVLYGTLESIVWARIIGLVLSLPLLIWYVRMDHPQFAPKGSSDT